MQFKRLFVKTARNVRSDGRWLNLFRLSARVPEYNQAAIALFRKFGFVEEVRRRQALDRDGRRWDLIVFGLLNSEWQNQAKPVLSEVEG